MRVALISSVIAPLRAEPRPDAELADEALCGMKVELLQQQGNWFFVRTHYRYEGWVEQNCLCLDEALIKQWEPCQKQVVLQAYVDVLAEPKVQGSLIGEATRGALLSPTGETKDGWKKVRFCDGREGWTWGAFLGEYKTDWNPSDEAALRRALTDTARAYLGTQYRWGGKTPLGIDCSGLCSMAYLLNGILISRDAHLKPEFPMHKIPMEKMQEGDLLFFPGHVAMYLGNQQYIHSTAGNNCHGVVINSLDPNAPDYRADLPEKIEYIGSIF